MRGLLSKPERAWPLFWGAACLALCAVIALEIAYGRPDLGALERPGGRMVEAKLLPPFALSPEALAGAEAMQRPLFLPGRRPAPPVQPSAAMQKGRYVLLGTTIVGDLAIAMVKETSAAKIYRVRKGDRLFDVTLAEVAPTHVTFTSGADSETVPLLVAKAGAAQGPGVSAASAAFGPFGAPPSPAGAAAPAPQSGSNSPSPSPATGMPQAVTGSPQAATAPAAAPGENLTPEEVLARRRAARAANRPNRP